MDLQIELSEFHNIVAPFLTSEVYLVNEDGLIICPVSQCYRAKDNLPLALYTTGKLNLRPSDVFLFNGTPVTTANDIVMERHTFFTPNKNALNEGILNIIAAMQLYCNDNPERYFRNPIDDRRICLLYNDDRSLTVSSTEQVLAKGFRTTIDTTSLSTIARAVESLLTDVYALIEANPDKLFITSIEGDVLYVDFKYTFEHIYFIDHMENKELLTTLDAEEAKDDFVVYVDEPVSVTNVEEIGKPGSITMAIDFPASYFSKIKVTSGGNAFNHGCQTLINDAREYTITLNDNSYVIFDISQKNMKLCRVAFLPRGANGPVVEDYYSMSSLEVAHMMDTKLKPLPMPRYVRPRPHVNTEITDDVMNAVNLGANVNRAYKERMRTQLANQVRRDGSNRRKKSFFQPRTS